MSYWGENETAVEEVCANCRETNEEHRSDLCTCGHLHRVGHGGRICFEVEECGGHDYVRDTRELCPNGSGEVFRRREPNDGH